MFRAGWCTFDGDVSTMGLQVRVRQLGSYSVADMFVAVDPGLSVGEGHDKGNLVRGTIMEHFSEVHDVIIHVCPPHSTHPHE